MEAPVFAVFLGKDRWCNMKIMRSFFWGGAGVPNLGDKPSPPAPPTQNETPVSGG